MYTSTNGYYYQGAAFKAKKSKALHINRIRFIRVLVLMVLFAGSFLFGAMMHAYATDEEHATEQMFPSQQQAIPNAYVSYSVESGDTLWAIAKAYQPADTDIREFIYEIKAMNHLKSSALQEGQLLQIPTIE